MKLKIAYTLIYTLNSHVLPKLLMTSSFVYACPPFLTLKLNNGMARISLIIYLRPSER